MKNTIFLLFLLVLFAFTGDTPYKDGNYTGMSRSFYTEEPYWGQTKITVENGRITRVIFHIRDSAKHEYFNEAYARYFEGNALYMEQCKNDSKGMRAYPDSLLKYQDPAKVDVISGATWSYNIFRASVESALQKAKE